MRDALWRNSAIGGFRHRHSPRAADLDEVEQEKTSEPHIGPSYARVTATPCASVFGHERGALTGAIAQKIGRFEVASGGTLFLDEVGEIPLDLQPKLLRVLQEQEFERIGSTKTVKVNVRLIAATNRDLRQMVEEHHFATTFIIG